MKGGSKLFIFAGVGLALVAVLLFVTSMKGNGGKAEEKSAQSATTVSIVKAKTGIRAHRVITVENVVVVQVEKADAPEGAAKSVNEVVGLSYTVDLPSGEVVMRDFLETPGLRNDIEPGKRAIALPVDNLSAMAGLVQTGDYVDIIFQARIDLLPTGAPAASDGSSNSEIPVTAEAGDAETTPEPTATAVVQTDADGNVIGDGQPTIGDPGTEFFIRDDIGDVSDLEAVAKIMLQDIRILRVVRPGQSYQANGTAVQPGADAAPVAADAKGQFILEVTPEQAELVAFIQDHHQGYQIVIRNKDDHETVDTDGITYQILATDEQWGMPWPKSVIAPEASPVPDANSADDAAKSDNKDESESDG